MTSEPQTKPVRRTWMLPVVFLLAALCASLFAVRQTALEWTPSAERSHTGAGAIAAWAVVLGISVSGVLPSRWRLWWAKVPLLLLSILSGYQCVDLLVFSDYAKVKEKTKAVVAAGYGYSCMHQPSEAEIQTLEAVQNALADWGPVTKT